MRLTSCLLILALITASWAILPTTQAASQPSWLTAAAVSPVFLQQSGGPAWMPSSAGGGSNRSHLPDSAMPNTLPPSTICSVDDSDGGVPCSAQETTAVKQCSAHCDSDQFCSAFEVGPAAVPASCSTLGGRVRCSVLQPPSTQGNGLTYCSTTSQGGGAGSFCSVLAPGKKAACTAQNPARLDNWCSAAALPGGASRSQCSVLGSGNVPGYCSTGFRPGQNPKLCSTFGGGGEVCSILQGHRGVCTNLKKAPAGTCSAHVAGSHCSTIGGAPGTRCKG